ncbi:MAG TPA: hypothetical protein DEA47_02880 [Peptococcaceae bacterium]|nr:MAG: hypothetical protein XD50_1454 [Clostridia bacterium 41_269]HBT20302.1 hypothetical protein [Peptococcaceae bacterium]
MGDLIFLLLILYLVFRSYARAKRRRWEYEEKRRRSKQDLHKHIKPEPSIPRTIPVEEVVPKIEELKENLFSLPSFEETEEKTANFPDEKAELTCPKEIVAEKGKSADLKRRIVPAELYKGVVYAEILGPPRAKKPWLPKNGWEC